MVVCGLKYLYSGKSGCIRAKVAQLAVHCTGIAEVTGSNPAEA